MQAFYHKGSALSTRDPSKYFDSSTNCHLKGKRNIKNPTTCRAIGFNVYSSVTECISVKHYSNLEKIASRSSSLVGMTSSCRFAMASSMICCLHPIQPVRVGRRYTQLFLSRAAEERLNTVIYFLHFIRSRFAQHTG